MKLESPAFSGGSTSKPEKRRTLSIRFNNFRCEKLELDGVDIRSEVGVFSIEFPINETPRLIVEVPNLDIEIEESEIQADI